MARVDSAKPEGYPIWTDLAAPDAQAASQFYANVLGWEFDVSGDEYGGYRMARTGTGYVAGIGEIGGSDFPPAWTVYFRATDADEMVERAKKLGATVFAPTMDVGNQGRMAVVQDPTGAVFGIWQPLEHYGAQVENETGSHVWSEVNTTDHAAAGDFYASLLGARTQGMEGLSTPYLTLHKGDEAIGGILQMNEQWQGIPPHWMVYFQVDDVDSALDRAEAGGGNIAVRPFDSPYGRVAVVSDPFGANFTLIQRPATG